jgi:hypothetical protein
MSMVGFPLLLIPLAIYNIIVFLMPGVSFADPILRLTLMSGVDWPITLADMLLALGIILLMLEIIKGSRPGAKYLTDHLLSLIIFCAAAAEFLLWPKFGTSVFCLLTLLALVDFVSGLTLRARRGVQVAAPASRRSLRRAESATVEPRNETEAPKQAGNNANDIAPPQRSPVPPARESAPISDPALKAAPAGAGPGGDSPAVQSPDLHPTDGSSAAPQPPQH